MKDDPDILAARVLNRAIAANMTAASDFNHELTTLACAARMMGNDALSRTLDELATRILAQARHVSDMYSGALYAECDANIAAIFSTINAALAPKDRSTP